MADRPWPSPSVIALICSRKGDPQFTMTPGVAEEKCYCCGEIVWASTCSQQAKTVHGAGAEYICLPCFNSKYRLSDPNRQALYHHGQRIA